MVSMSQLDIGEDALQSASRRLDSQLSMHQNEIMQRAHSSLVPNSSDHMQLAIAAKLHQPLDRD